MIGGFTILTLDQHGDHPVDYSSEFSLDGTGLTYSAIDAATFAYDIDIVFPSELSTYKLTFDTEQIDSNGGCYVKYTFPAEIDISEVEVNSITGTGLLVDQDGLS